MPSSTPPSELPPADDSRAPRWLWFAPVVILVAICFPAIADFYVHLKWFASLGYGDVLTTTVRAQLLTGVTTGAFFFALLYFNGAMALRITRAAPPRFAGPGVDLTRMHAAAERLPLIYAGVLSVLAGFRGSLAWETWWGYANASEFGAQDPLFQHDIGFYVFTLPALESARAALVWVLVLSAIGAATLHALRSSLRMLDGRVIFTLPAKRHAGVLVALGLIVLAGDAWLSTRELLFANAGPVAGAGYADVNATLPMLRLEIGAAVLAAIVALVSSMRETPSLKHPVMAMALFAVVNVVGVRVYPELVHRFSVLPNEAQKEARFIGYNIEATRAAYGLDQVTERDLSTDEPLTLEDIESNHATIDNIRLWDHRPLLDTFAQIQEIRTYYEFASVDNDRYVIDGELRQTMLSPRELAASSLPHLTWINERFTFTHGYGVTLGPVNRATSEGLPELFVQDIPPVSTSETLDITRPGIYFGELSNDYVFVNTAADEFDHPSGDSSVFESYQGDAGIPLDSALIRTMFATVAGGFKVLLSDDIRPDSRVLFHRQIQERVQVLAPFLVYDSDPYMVVRDDGTLAWIMDAYTATHRYPYSQPTREGMNYMRNSVKVVIDAYNGDTTFYSNDDDDPILRTWRRIYPSLFVPLAEMPDDLQRHLRHPEDLFGVQTDLFTVYHMDEPEDVYNREDQWEVPSLAGESGNQRTMEPYYTIMRLPEEDSEEFILMIPYAPKSKQNLAAWMVARSDGEHRGELIVYRFPKDRLIFGPQQIMNRIQQDAEISRQVSLWDQRGSQAIFGTLLVIPVEESLIYVAPLYLRSEGGRIPELKRVIAVYGTQIAMEPTLDGAVAAIFGETAPPTEAEATPPSDDAPAVGVQDVVRAQALYRLAIQAQREGRWAEYGEHLDALGAVLETLSVEAAAADPGDEEPEPSQPQEPPNTEATPADEADAADEANAANNTADTAGQTDPGVTP